MKKYLLSGAVGALVLTSYAMAGLAPHVKISAARAKKVAVLKYPGKIVGKVALENEDGKWQYAVNVRSGKKTREIMVDATTGKIASMEITTVAEEAKEKSAEAKAKHH